MGFAFTFTLSITLILPPIGNNLYVASTLTKFSVTAIAKKAAPFMGARF